MRHLFYSYFYYSRINYSVLRFVAIYKRNFYTSLISCGIVFVFDEAAAEAVAAGRTGAGADITIDEAALILFVASFMLTLPLSFVYK